MKSEPRNEDFICQIAYGIKKLMSVSCVIREHNSIESHSKKGLKLLREQTYKTCDVQCVIQLINQIGGKWEDGALE
jgi:hypothetical protein